MTAHVVAGQNAAEAIVAEARTQGADVIALATHGRGGLRRALLGSIADTLIRTAAIPVLVYSPQAK